jgi:hypothetical protein
LTTFYIFSGNFAKISIPQFLKKTLGVEKYYTNSPTQLGAAFFFFFSQFCDVAQVGDHPQAYVLLDIMGRGEAIP